MTSGNNATAGTQNGTSNTATGASGSPLVAEVIVEHRVIAGVGAERQQQRGTDQDPADGIAGIAEPTLVL